MNKIGVTLFAVCGFCCFLSSIAAPVKLNFIQPCSRSLPHDKFDQCLAKSVNNLAMMFKQGLPELGYQEVEPIILDKIQISLGGGPNGYRAKFTNIQARGVSEIKVTNLKSRITDDVVELQVSMFIPKINATAKYESSGTLILVQASGEGDYWGKYDDVKAKVYIKAKPEIKSGTKFLRLQQVKMDFTVKGIKMGVINVQNQNQIVQAALNLFINSNGQELLTEMKPALRVKLVQQMSKFVKNIFEQVPYESFISN